MPTTQRLLTDVTGQALVTAVNNIVAAVKPNATEIQMSSSDTTTVAEAINTTNQAITNINNKLRVISTGSLHDIRTAGIYWLTSAVADKPEAGAGVYVLNIYGNDYISGTYTAADSHKMYTIGLTGGTWTYTELAPASAIGNAKITITGDNATTFSIPISNRNPGVFMAFLVIRRDNLYPAIWVLGVGTGASPSVVIKQVLALQGTALTDATISNNILTLTFNATAYGGIAVIQL